MVSMPGGGTAKRVVLESAGWTLLVLGIAAMVLPGPGLLGVFAGLALLSQQYEWAERYTEPVKLRALKAAAEGVETIPRIVLSVAGVAALAGFGVLWILSPPSPGWWPFARVAVASRRRRGRHHPGVLRADRVRPDRLQPRKFRGRPDAVEVLGRQVKEADAELAKHKESRKERRKAER